MQFLMLIPNMWLFVSENTSEQNQNQKNIENHSFL
jgi:hypothetical protein